MWSAHARSIGAAAVRLSLPDRESGKRPQWSARLLGLIPSRGRPRVGPVPAWRRERQPGAHACAQRSGSSLNSERNVLPSAWSASAPQISLVSSARRASTICRRASLPSSQARPRSGGAQPLERLARYAPATAQPGVHRCHDGRRDRRLSGALPTSQALPATAASPCRHRIRQVQARWCQVIWRLWQGPRLLRPQPAPRCNASSPLGALSWRGLRLSKLDGGNLAG